MSAARDWVSEDPVEEDEMSMTLDTKSTAAVVSSPRTIVLTPEESATLRSSKANPQTPSSKAGKAVADYLRFEAEMNRR